MVRADWESVRVSDNHMRRQAAAGHPVPLPRSWETAALVQSESVTAALDERRTDLRLAR